MSKMLFDIREIDDRRVLLFTIDTETGEEEPSALCSSTRMNNLARSWVASHEVPIACPVCGEKEDIEWSSFDMQDGLVEQEGYCSKCDTEFVIGFIPFYTMIIDRGG